MGVRGDLWGGDGKEERVGRVVSDIGWEELWRVVGRDGTYSTCCISVTRHFVPSSYSSSGKGNWKSTRG